VVLAWCTRRCSIRTSRYTARVVAGDAAAGAAPLDTVIGQLRQQFPSLLIEDQHVTTATLKIEGTVNLADLFAALEQQKTNSGIVDYSCSQTSLEQIFLRYAREDEGDDETRPAAPPVAYPYSSQHPSHSSA